MYKFNFNVKPVAMALSCALLTACGGSGSDSPDIGNFIPPIVNIGDDISVEEQTTVTLTASASDDGTVTGVLWQQTAGIGVELGDTQTESLTFTAPTVVQEQVLTFSFTAADNDGYSTTASVNVTVLPINESPTVTTSDNIAVRQNSEVNLEANAVDSDGEIVSIAWQQMSGTQVQFNGGDTSAITFVSPEVSQTDLLSFTVTATDNEGGQTQDTVEVVVVSTDDEPWVRLPKDFWVTHESIVVIDPPFSSGVGVDNTTWTQTSGPTVELGDFPSGLVFTAPNADEGSLVLGFDFTIRDTRGLEASDSIEILVSNDQINDINGVSFRAGEQINWERSSQWQGYIFQSDVDIGHNRYGAQATINVPYLAEPTELELMISHNDKQYVQSKVNLLTDSNIGYTKVDHSPVIDGLNVDGKKSIYQDFNGDGTIDLLLYSTSRVEWFAGNPNGGFGQAQLIVEGEAIEYVTAQTLNDENGYLVVQSVSGQIDVYSFPSSQANNEFMAMGRYSGVANSSAWSLNAAQLDSDTDIELAATYLLDGKLQLITLDLVDGALVATVIDADVNGSEKGQLYVTDINNDGQQDIVVLAQNSNVLTYTRGNSGYSKTQRVDVQDPENEFTAKKLLPVDINRDGLKDFVVLREVDYFGGRTITQRLNALINNGDNTWYYGEDITMVESAYAHEFTVADMDDDGFEDVVVLNDFYRCNTCFNITVTRSGDISWYANNQTETMASKKVIAYPSIYDNDSPENNESGAAMHVVDVNGDGKMDIAHLYQLNGFVMNHYLRQ